MDSKDKTERALAGLERRIEAAAKKRDTALMAGDIPAAEKQEKHLAALSIKADVQRRHLHLIAEKEIADLGVERQEKIRALSRELEQLEKAEDLGNRASEAAYALHAALVERQVGFEQDWTNGREDALKTLLADVNESMAALKPVDLKGAVCIRKRLTSAAQERADLIAVMEVI